MSAAETARRAAAAAGDRSGRPVAAPPVAERIGAILTRGERPPRPGPLTASLAFGWRAMLKIKYVPEQLSDVTVFPIIMVLMFTYLFGGALAGSPGEYLQYLLPGILVTGVVMTTMYTGATVNADIATGVFDRFRTLPVWRPAALVGLLLGDVVRYLLAAATMLAVGTAIGFRPAGGVTGVLAGVGLLAVFAVAFSWVWTLLGLLLRTPRSVMGVSLLVIFPLTFLSNVFVDPATMPGPLRAFVAVNPITHVVAAVRGLMGGVPDGGEVGWVLTASAVLVAVFGPLAMRRYDRR